ncbi:hypothetical protein [Achromobacter sp. UMC46]|uniref:hypothetical protein n=1 Tax=Achromobacter sp. UMC46 TaxID=1862319 RepID=UPI001601EE4C|nr:hypothetical protein [Achromobacter sp. UMC46]MBB1593561.1 hypothetical protein [Achromobacter sp. UMC46]
MTDQNNAAQAWQDTVHDAILILTEEADALSDCHTRAKDDWAQEPEAKARYDHILAVAEALSKLRAPVADEDRRPTAPDDDAIAECWINASDCDGIAYDGPSFERGYRAALASAPVAGERECGNADCGWRGTTERMCGSVGPLCPECGEVTEAIAPVSGEVVAWRVTHPRCPKPGWQDAAREPAPSLNEVKQQDADLALELAYAAPQASEAVRQAIKACGSKVTKALAAIARADGPNTRKADEPELIYRSPVMDEVVRIRQAYDVLESVLKTQADEDGAVCSCPTGDGSLRWPCAVHRPGDKDGGRCPQEANNER